MSNISDEEIDEDEAFDEEDYKRWGDIGTSSKRKRDENEDDESEETDDPEAVYTNLSDFLGVSDQSDSEEEVDSDKHEALLKKLGNLERPKKKARTEVQEAREEGQFNFPTQGKLSISDLMTGKLVDDSEFSGLRSHMSRLQRSEEQNLEQKPVHRLQRERELRTVQFEDTSRLVSQWSETVKQMQTAPTLIFPLKPEKAQAVNLAHLSKLEATSDFEKSIDNILKERGLQSEKDLGSELVSNKDMAERTNELIKMRHLLHYQEKKLAWHSKIKSKKYRKILRKAKEKNKLTFEELKELDPEAAKVEAEKRDRERAHERMTQRHKASKFAKQAKRNASNPILQQALNDQHQIAKEKKSKGQAELFSSESDSFDSGDSMSEDEQSSEEEKKGVWGMKFMKNADERQKIEFEERRALIDAEHDEKVQKLQRFLQRRNQLFSEDGSGSANGASQAEESKVVGRKTFGVKNVKAGALPSTYDNVFESEEDSEGNPVVRDEEPKPEDSDDAEDEPKLNIKLATKASSKPPTNSTKVEAGKSVGSKKQTETVKPKLKEFTPEETKSLRSKNELKFKVHLDSDDDEAPANPAASTRDLEMQREESSSEEEEGFNLVSKANAQQRELILRAFANDDVESQFNEEKRKIVEEDLPQDQTTPVLPGWGEWAGEGIVAQPRQPSKRKQEALEKKRKEALEKRKDSKLSHVIISQEVDKKASKYQIADLPFGMPNKEIYDSTMRNPLGKAWNSALAQKDLVTPRIQVHAGAIIEPVSQKAKKVAPQPEKGNERSAKRGQTRKPFFKAEMK